jgi:GPN-loop GTPase
MHRINLYMNEHGLRGYFVNLDPAVRSVPFSANIDIRDTVDYKEVMKQYGLGPNGAILTSLNLFATRFDQVVGILERRSDDVDYIFVDTPGQIEVFTWSAGGQIIHELLASSFPTVVMYVSDTPRCASPTTFMSNMLYSCSILYKSKLPMVCAFNKTDVVGCRFATEWMNDFEAFSEALDADRKEEYMTSFNRSLSLVMDEFYRNIKRCGISAVSGDGFSALFTALDESAVEFYESYYPEQERRKTEREAERAQVEAAKVTSEMAKLMKDLRPDGKQVPDRPPTATVDVPASAAANPPVPPTDA